MTVSIAERIDAIDESPISQSISGTVKILKWWLNDPYSDQKMDPDNYVIARREAAARPLTPELRTPENIDCIIDGCEVLTWDRDKRKTPEGAFNAALLGLSAEDTPAHRQLLSSQLVAENGLSEDGAQALIGLAHFVLVNSKEE